MIFLLIKIVLTQEIIQPDNLLCALKLYYQQSTSFLLSQPSNSSMPYIVTSASPHFALDIQKQYSPSKALNNASYFLQHLPDAFVFAADVSHLKWIEIQEFKVKKKSIQANTYTYNGYFGYYLLNGKKGGHVLVSKSKLERDFRLGKTDSSDKFSKGGLVYLFAWEGDQDSELMFKRFTNLLQQTEERNFCELKTLELTLAQISCNLDQNFNRITFHIPDLYHPPIHYHIGNALLNETSPDYLVKQYPGLQVLVAQNLQDKILEMRFPIKHFETNQLVFDHPIDGLAVTVREGNRGFIHILIFQDEDGMVFDYLEDSHLGYIKVGYTNHTVQAFSYVTSSFGSFPTDELVGQMFLNAVQVSGERNNVCSSRKESTECEVMFEEYFHQQEFKIPSNDAIIRFEVNRESQETPYIQILKDEVVSIEFEQPNSQVSNLELNHAGYVGSLFKLRLEGVNINSMIVNHQSPNLEVTYEVRDNVYLQTVSNITGMTYVVVFTSQIYFDDILSLQLFREFVDHLQRTLIFEQIQTGCKQSSFNFDIQPIEYNAVHKSIQFSPEFVQKQTIDEEPLEEHQDSEPEQDSHYRVVIREDPEYGVKGPKPKQAAENSQINLQEQDGKKPQNSHQNVQPGRSPGKLPEHEADKSERPQASKALNKQPEDSGSSKELQSTDQEFQEFYVLGPGGRQGDAKSSGGRPPPPVLVGQSVQVPRNPDDAQLGRFFREVITRLHVYGDPCQRDSPDYDPELCKRNGPSYQNYRDPYDDYNIDPYNRRDPYDRRDSYYRGYGNDRYGDRESYYPRDQYYSRDRDLRYRGQRYRGRDYYGDGDPYYGRGRDDPYYMGSRYVQQACITVYSKCDYQGDQLVLCGHQRLLPKAQEAMEVYSLRAEEHFVIEFYVKNQHGQSELYTLKGSQPCLKYPLRVDQFLQ